MTVGHLVDQVHHVNNREKGRFPTLIFSGLYYTDRKKGQLWNDSKAAGKTLLRCEAFLFLDTLFWPEFSEDHTTVRIKGHSETDGRGIVVLHKAFV